MDAVICRNIPTPILTFLYPLKEPNYTRTKELQVLCLGLGRTGTESLRTALYELGYSEVHHGWRLASDTAEVPQWYRLALAKFRRPNPAFLNRGEFDKVLGNCEAIADLPSAIFAIEILRAYPEAKAVLNRRRDVDKWHQSMMATLGNMYTDWGSWLRQWVDSENFWLMRIVKEGFYPTYKGNVSKYGVEVYHQHYADLEAECRKQGREWLDWTVEDGWQPLCSFLGKATPDTPFPNENAGAGFAQKRVQLHWERHRRANRRLATCAGLLLMGGIVGGAWWWRDSHLARASLQRIGGAVKSIVGL